MQSGQQYQSATSFGLWLTVQEFKTPLCLWKEWCSFGNDKVTDYRCNRSERGNWFSAPYLDQLWSSTITECVMGAFSLPGEEVMKAS